MTSQRLEAELCIAQTGLDSFDEDLLLQLVKSRGRTWIESAWRIKALQLLKQMQSKVPRESELGLWAHYLISIEPFLGDGKINENTFSSEHQQLAERFGLSLLFRAEELQFFRKHGDREQALTALNALLPLVDKDPESSATAKYVWATTLFLLSNMLRFGGRYDKALLLIERACGVMNRKIEAHATELDHFDYELRVCRAMLGDKKPDTAVTCSRHVHRVFSAALEKLTLSHESWAHGEVIQAERHSRDAAALFRDVYAPRYAERAALQASLLKAWKALSCNRDPECIQNQEISAVVREIVSGANGTSRLVDWCAKSRPSLVLGILQFAQFGKPDRDLEAPLTLPSVLKWNGKEYQWAACEQGKTLSQASTKLRELMQIPPSVRIPLFPD